MSRLRTLVVCLGAVWLLACGASDAWASDASSSDPASAALVERAARAYDAGRWDEASDALALLLGHDDVSRGLVLADLGACAFRRGRDATAVLCFRRALRHLPRDAGLRADLAVARRKLGLEPPREETFADSLGRLLALLTPREHLLLAAGLELAGLLLFVLARTRPVLRRIGAALVLLALLGVGRLLVERLDPPPVEGVLLTDIGVLHAEPDAEAPESGTLRAGDEVVVTARRDGWLSVVHPRGEGWIAAHLVGLVED
ncbi:MAG: SH3 domain-containing protein [Planctomycetes bacterium]|nr:SH3 domain-containing protein [Planctomycetota bacterium]